MVIPPAQPAHPRQSRLARTISQAVHRFRKTRIPFRSGQVVVGDDPFNGRREGTVEVISPPYLGLRVPGTPAGSLVFFDHRSVRYPD